MRFISACTALFISVCALGATRQTVSYVDTSLDGSQKYMLIVDGTPFYMTAIQVRLDKLNYSCGWSSKGLDAIVKQAASDGFNTVSIPLMWTEVEPEKDHFDWTVLDMYLEMVTKAGIKMELLWFGNNSVGGVAKMNMRDNKSKNRVPDYVLSSSNDGPKSEFRIRTDINDRTMDISDKRLMEREKYVLSNIMDHIAKWDRKHGGKHTVIGVQIENEIFGAGASFPNSQVIDYASHIAEAVKESDYVVWTRMNSVYWEVDGRIPENEWKRLDSEGTNIDFIGLDSYKHHPQFKTYEMYVASMRKDIMYCGKNYRMFMEVGAEVSGASQLYIAALSGNCAFDYYDMCGIDGHGLYDVTGIDSFAPHGAYIDDIRNTNKVIVSDIRDVARFSNGYGLFVHNWNGSSSMESKGSTGVTYFPGTASSQGISITRSQEELVLMSTAGGQFTIPAPMGAYSCSSGKFDLFDKWQEDAAMQMMSSRNGDKSVSLAAGMTVRVLCSNTGYKAPKMILQAENARVGGSASVESGNGRNGFAGNGYALLPCNGAGYVRWENIDAGLSGGEKEIRIRYANPFNYQAVNSVFVNGQSIGLISMDPTGSEEQYGYYTMRVVLGPGTNTLEIASVAGDVVGVSGLDFHSGGQIDELQIME